jgi:hypothetical protein
MKLVKTYGEFLNEKYNPLNESFQGLNNRFTKSAEIIKNYISKKSRTKYVMYPFPVTHTIDGQTSVGIMLFTDSNESAIKITQGTSGNVIKSIEYFSKHYSDNVDFQVSSDTFPIIKLLNEFIRLMDDKYNKSINESVYEGHGLELINESLDKSTIQEIESMLDRDISAREISEQLGIPYKKILRLKRNLSSDESVSPVESKNTMTLDDKVKLLDEIMDDIYDISRKVAAGAFNSLFISGRAGTGKTFNVERGLKDEGLDEGDDFIVVSGAASVIMIYKTLFQFNNKTIVFDDCDSVFKDESGRNILKAALDTKKVRNISYLKKSSMVYDVIELQDKPEEEFNAIESGLVPNRFDFTGRVIFISNLAKEKADPDGAIRSRSILIDVAPDDMTLMERLKRLLPQLEPVDMPLKDKEEIFDFLKKSKDISMRTFVKAAGFKTAGLKNWQRMAERYL